MRDGSQSVSGAMTQAPGLDWFFSYISWVLIPHDAGIHREMRFNKLGEMKFNVSMSTEELTTCSKSIWLGTWRGRVPRVAGDKATYSCLHLPSHPLLQNFPANINLVRPPNRPHQLDPGIANPPRPPPSLQPRITSATRPRSKMLRQPLIRLAAATARPVIPTLTPRLSAR